MSSMRRTLSRKMKGVNHIPFAYYDSSKGKGKNKSRGFRTTKTVMVLHSDLYLKAKKAK